MVGRRERRSGEREWGREMAKNRRSTETLKGKKALKIDFFLKKNLRNGKWV